MTKARIVPVLVIDFFNTLILNGDLLFLLDLNQGPSD